MEINMKREFKNYYDKMINVDYPEHDDFIRESAEEIVNVAFDNWVENCADGTCEITEAGELESNCFTGNSYNDDTNLEVYRLDSNWIAQNCWDDHNMMVDDDEWKQLQEKYGEDADFTDNEQLEAIGVDRNNRLKEYLVSGLKG